MKIKRKSILGIILLFLTSFIWGTAFIAQSDAMDHIGPFTMNGLRTLLAAIVLFPTALVVDKLQGKQPTLFGVKGKQEIKKTLIAGSICGILIAVASTVQQFGIAYTSIGKSGFLTTLYVVFVPLLALFFGKKIKFNGWIAVVLALVGMFFICIDKSEPINIGDVLTIICAFFFAVHILFVDKFVQDIDGIRLSLMQFSVCAVVCLICAAIFEKNNLEDILNASFSIVYAGIFSAALGYTLQIVAQKWVAPNVAPLVMCMESVIALLAGAIMRNEVMKPHVYIGCILVFIAIVLAQIQFKERKPKRNKK